MQRQVWQTDRSQNGSLGTVRLKSQTLGGPNESTEADGPDTDSRPSASFSGLRDGQSASRHPANRPETARRTGAELKLKLKSGEKLQGSVESIRDDSFVFSSKDDRASREIAFNDLENVSYPKRGYKAEGTPDPVAAKRMVVQLGVGEHIMVKVSPTEKVRGRILEVQDDHFVIQPDGQTSRLKVPYNSILKVNKNLSFGATIAILVGIAAVVVLVLVLSGKDDVNVLPD